MPLWTLPEGSGTVRKRLRAAQALEPRVGDQHKAAGPPVIRIAPGAWRVAPRPQPWANRRTIVATSTSGTPTGQAAAAASRSGASPPRSDDASPNRA